MTLKPIVENKDNPVFVSAFTFGKFGLKPHVVLTIGRQKRGKQSDARTAKLTAREARQLAIALLAEAEKVEVSI